MTITTGATLAPDDDASPDAAEDHPVVSVETGAAARTGSSHVFVPHVIGGISLTVAPDVVSEGPPPDALDVDDRTSPGSAPDLDLSESPGPRPNDPVGPEIDSPLLSVIAVTTTEAPPAPPRAPLTERLRAALPFTGPGLTGLGGVILGCLVVGLGAAVDLAQSPGLGVGFTATFLAGCVVVAAALRTRSLAVAVVLPPLLFAGGYLLETQASGQTVGRREMALDVATSLALHAPTLFIGTALAVSVVLGRVFVHLVRR